MNHAVLYVRDAARHQKFYEDVLGFQTVIDGPGPFVFMRAPASENHHDIAFFAIGEQAEQSRAGQQTVGLYHIAWEVGTLDELEEMPGAPARFVVPGVGRIVHRLPVVDVVAGEGHGVEGIVVDDGEVVSFDNRPGRRVVFRSSRLSFPST